MKNCTIKLNYIKNYKVIFAKLFIIGGFILKKEIQFTTQTEHYLSQIDGLDYSNVKLVTFKYMLPFRIPVENGLYFVTYENNKKTLIKFTHTIEKDPFRDTLPIAIDEEKRTVVEITRILTNKSFKRITEARSGKLSDELTIIFDSLHSILNDFIKIVMMKYQYHNIYVISKGDIVSVPVYQVFKNNNGKVKTYDKKFFLISWPSKIVEDEKSNLNYFELSNIFQNWGVYKNHPTQNYTEKVRMGERYFYKEDYNNSIIYYQTGLEIFITNFCHDYYKITQNLKEDAIQQKLKSYKNTLNHHFIPAIKKLNIHHKVAIENCIELYYTNYYGMRNKIVHNGKSYNQADCQEFTSIVIDLIRLVVDGVKNSPKNDFSRYFSKYNIISDEIDIDEIRDKYIEN